MARRATAVEIFHTLEIENVTVANSPQSYRIETRRGPVQIVALPWVSRSAVRSREDSKNLSFDELNRKIEAVLSQWLNAQVESLDPSLPALLAGHLSHSGAVPGSEKTMMVGRDYVLLQSNLASPVFDYVALGHIHKRQESGSRVPIVYAGSLQTIDFGDEGQEKGFYVIQIEGTAGKGQRLRSYEFHAVKARRFLTIKVNADSADPMSAVLRALNEEQIKDAIVRLQIKTSAEGEGLLQESEIRKALKEAYCVAAIEKDVERGQRGRLNKAEGITPAEALRLYLES